MYACSKKGWMTSEIFQDWFLKFCEVLKQRPLLVILDGHISHLNTSTIRKAMEENIVLLKLPPHTTDLLQPLDKNCFGPLKLKWNEALIDWQRTYKRKLTKAEFCNLLCSIWEKGLTKNNVVSGFTSTGIFPCNREKYPKARLDTEKLKRYQSNLTDNPLAHPYNIDDNSADQENVQQIEQINEFNVKDNSANITNKDEAFPSNTDEQTKLTEENVLDLDEVGATAHEQPEAGCSGINTKITQSSSLNVSGGESPKLSFQDILLSRCANSTTASPAPKRKKIDMTGCVLTDEEYIAKIKAKEEIQGRKELIKIDVTKKKIQKNVVKSKGKQKKIEYSSESSSESQLSDYSVRDTDDDCDPFSDDELEQYRQQNSAAQQNKEESSEESYTVGQFVTVKYMGGKNNRKMYKYVSIIQRVIEDTEFEVMTLKSVDDSKTKFKTVESDINIVKCNDIIEKLPLPQLVLKGTRVLYIFPEKPDIYEN